MSGVGFPGASTIAAYQMTYFIDRHGHVCSVHPIFRRLMGKGLKPGLVAVTPSVRQQRTTIRRIFFGACRFGFPAPVTFGKFVALTFSNVW